MTGESQETPTSPPDPSVLTTEQLLRETAAQRDWARGQIEALVARLDGMDKATELLSETVNRTPTEIQKQIAHLRELMDEKFKSVDKQFDNKDKAIDAAFAAQEKQAASTFQAGADAREKMEKNTEKGLGGLSDTLGDLKDRVIRLETGALTRQTTRQESGASWGVVFGAVGALVAVISLVVVVALSFAK